MLAGDDGARAEEAAAVLSALVPLREVPDRPGTGVTVIDALGALMVSPPTGALWLAVAVVHEAAHTRLEMLSDLAPLIGPHDGSVHYAPWRPDPRPLARLLHGAFAFAQIAAFWAGRWARDGAGSDLGAAYEFAWCRDAVSAVLPVLREAAGLTEAGRRFVSALGARIDVWIAADLPIAATTTAATVLRDIAVVWRLRNRRPDRDHIERWARDWAAGRPCGRPVPPSSRLVPQTEPYSPHRHARQALTSLRFARTDRFGGLAGSAGFAGSAGLDPAAWPVNATLGDLLYVRGDLGLAAAEFRRELQDRPGRAESFAGLALVLARRAGGLQRRLYLDHPEALLALSVRIRELTGSTPDPRTLARWIAAGGLGHPDRSWRSLETRPLPVGARR
ncbi:MULTISPECIES: aKG-HExxH-type peptide beta-hydroxylase [unclassified Frankia]